MANYIRTDRAKSSFSTNTRLPPMPVRMLDGQESGKTVTYTMNTGHPGEA